VPHGLPPVPGSCVRYDSGLASLSAYGTICVDSGTVFAKSMTYCVMAGNWDFTRKAFPILSPEPFSAVKFTLPI